MANYRRDARATLFRAAKQPAEQVVSGGARAQSRHGRELGIEGALEEYTPPQGVRNATTGRSLGSALRAKGRGRRATAGTALPALPNSTSARAPSDPP